MTPSPPPGPRPLGPLLAELRLARGWSQQRMAGELCAASGVPTLTRHEISRWERQLRLPRDFWLGWLAVVLGVPGELLAEAAGHSRRLGAAPAAVDRAGSRSRAALAAQRDEPAVRRYAALLAAAPPYLPLRAGAAPGPGRPGRPRSTPRAARRPGDTTRPAGTG